MNKLGNKAEKVLLVLLVIFLLLATFLGGYLHHRVEKIGASVGEMNGKLVGVAIGSAKGVTIGMQEGKKAGVDAGLSAEDTVTEIKESMEALGRLEVLVAGVSLTNINKIGDTYKGLYIINGDAVFSVNMAETEIRFRENRKEVDVIIPEPELELFLDQNSTEKLAETQKFSWTVSAKDGLEAYLNSMTQIVENAKDTIANYDSLFSEAKESATTQVEQLITIICADDCVVHVQFK